MDIELFDKLLLNTRSEEERLDFIRKHFFHGIPYVFRDKEDDYFEFRNRIARFFSISFQEVFIVGSAKLGFSYHKNTDFSYDSDIDVAIVNQSLFDYYYEHICDYQYKLDKAYQHVSLHERRTYNFFLRYMVKGWMRPDMLPLSFQVDTLKSQWFDFFNSISHKRSEVGNYKVTGGLYRNHSYLEKYHRVNIETYYNILKLRSA